MDFSILNSLRIGHSAGKDFSDVQFYGTSIGKLVFLSIGPFTASLPVSICSVDHPELASLTKQIFSQPRRQESWRKFRRLFLVDSDFVTYSLVQFYQRFCVSTQYSDWKTERCAPFFWSHSYPEPDLNCLNDCKIVFFSSADLALLPMCSLCVWGFFSGQLFLFPLKNQPVSRGNLRWPT